PGAPAACRRALSSSVVVTADYGPLLLPKLHQPSCYTYTISSAKLTLAMLLNLRQREGDVPLGFVHATTCRCRPRPPAGRAPRRAAHRSTWLRQDHDCTTTGRVGPTARSAGTGGSISGRT